jgi:hypothetical protein
MIKQKKISKNQFKKINKRTCDITYSVTFCVCNVIVFHRVSYFSVFPKTLFFTQLSKKHLRQKLSFRTIEALGGKTALSRKHHSEINQFEII